MLLSASTGGDLEARGLNGSGVTEGGGHGGARAPHIGQVPPHMEIVVLKNHIVNYYGAPPPKNRVPPLPPLHLRMPSYATAKWVPKIK